MTSSFDPLGRIAEHDATPYDHPAVSITDLERYWRDLYGAEARALPDGDLATEHQRAIGAMAECEAEIKQAEVDRDAAWERYWQRVYESENGIAVVDTAAAANERANANAAVMRAEARLPRLTGKRDALVAEMKRRAA